MSFTFDTSTNIGKVRTLIGDTDSTSYLLSDEEIQVFLTLESNDLYASAAGCLRSIASSKALLEKVIKAGNYSEDTRGISKALNDLANKYESRSANVPAEGCSEEYLTAFNWNEILTDRALRGEIN